MVWSGASVAGTSPGLKFWQDFFDLHVERLNPARRLKLALIVAACRLLGASVIHLALEAIEVYGVRKYLKVWTAYSNSPLGPAVRSVLVDEFKHEDTLVTGDAERRLNPERVRNIFLGLNDGLVEILGAVSGFFAAFGNSIAVLVAGLTDARKRRPGQPLAGHGAREDSGPERASAGSYRCRNRRLCGTVCC